jgi:UDP-N-acetyl-D-galactosamine dehydrogenase
MNKKGVMVKNAHILILGFSFKENCPDIRNTKVADIYHTLLEYTDNITVYDPWTNPDQVKQEYGIEINIQASTIYNQRYDAVILAVAHQEILDMDMKKLVKPNGVIYDVKGVLPREIVDGRL